MYKACDENLCDQATVTITINGLNDKPVAVDDYININIFDAATLNATNNDSDVEGNLDVSTVSFDPTSVPSGIGTDTDSDGDIDQVVCSEGTWIVDENGDVTYVPIPGNTDDPTPIEYTVKDFQGFSSNKASITIDYNPIASDDLSDCIIPGNSVVIDVVDNDNNGDAVDPTTVQVVGTANPGDPLYVVGEGTWSVNGTNGNITFTPEQGYAGAPTPIQYSVDDNEGNTSNQATVTINVLPPAPVSGGDQIECEESPMQILIATATPAAGSSVVWYSSETGSTVVQTPVLGNVGTMTYWAASRDNTTDCESLGRTPVTLTIGLSPAAPISGGNQAECEEYPTQTLTATATAPLGSSVVWYYTATGSYEAVDPTLNIPGSITYYAASRDNITFCESNDRVAVTLTIVSAPAAPIANSISECATGGVIPTLTATATTQQNAVLVWYDAPVGGNVVTNVSWSQLGSITFYAEAVDISTGCISVTRTAVTLTIHFPPTVGVGDDLEVCETELFVPVFGYAENASDVLWTTDGSGFFDNPNAGSTLYYLSGDDILNGTVDLCLTAFAFSPCTGIPSDCMTVTINAGPNAYAGSNAFVCEGGSYSLVDAWASDYSTIEWTSTGDGAFDDPNVESPVYTPGPDDIATGGMELCMTAYPKIGCPDSVVDCMALNIAIDPTVEVGIDIELDCGDYDETAGEWLPLVMDVVTTGDIGSVLWTTNGDGYFDDPTELYAIYNLGLDDIWKGDIELCVEVSGVGSCPFSTSDCMTVYVPQQLIYYDKDAWWGLSSYLDPDLTTVPEVMDPLVIIPGSQHLITMIEKQGDYFWPEPIPPTNVIGDWRPIGYKIKTKNAPACLPIYGDSLINQVFVVEGPFTFLPVLTNVPVTINELFGSHVNDILLMYDWPTGDLWTQVAYDFDVLMPGRAYLLVNKNPGSNYTIEFPDFDPTAPHLYPISKDFVLNNNSPWNDVENTSQPHILMFADDALKSLEPGDIIGAFDKENICYGFAGFEDRDSFYKLVAMGDNPYSKHIDGFEPGGLMTFKIYRQRTGETFEVSFVYDEGFPNYDGLFAVNGVSRVIGITMGITTVSEVGNSYDDDVNVFPNPAREVVNITSGHEMKNIMLINYVGQVMLSREVRGDTYQFDVSIFNTGMYILRIETTDGRIITKRLSIK